MIVVGDFQTADMMKQIQAAFGKLGKPGTLPVTTSAPLVPGGSEATLGKSPPKAPIVLKEAGSTPLLNAVYPLPDVSSPDAPALKVLDYVLLSGRTSKLYQSMFESGLAADGGTLPYQFARGGWYTFSFTPTPDTDLPKLDAALLATLADVRTNLVSAEEIARAKTSISTSTLLGTRSIDAQATSLGMDATTAGDYQYTDKFLAALQTVTPEDVRRVAQKYLPDSARTVGYFEPTKAVDGQRQRGQRGWGHPGSLQRRAAGRSCRGRQVSARLAALGPGQDHPARQVHAAQRHDRDAAERHLHPHREPQRQRQGRTRVRHRHQGRTRRSGGGQLALGHPDPRRTDPGQAARRRGRAALSVGQPLRGADRRGQPRQGFAGALDRARPTSCKTPPSRRTSSSARRPAPCRAPCRPTTTPAAWPSRCFARRLYPAGNPWQVFSSPETIGALSRQDALDFYKTHYRPDATVLTLVGNFDPAQVRTLLNQTFGGWSASGPAPQVVYPVIGKPNGIVKAFGDLPGKTQAVTYLGYQSIARSDPRYYASLVLNDVLGGSTLSSRLGTELRDKEGLTYGVGSGFAALKQPGAFSISLQTNPKDTDKAVQGALNILKDVRDNGLTATEVATSKNGLLSSYTVGLSNPAALAATFTSLVSDGLPLSELTDYQAKINAVTPAAVNQAAKELLDPDNVVEVTAGPGNGK